MSESAALSPSNSTLESGAHTAKQDSSVATDEQFLLGAKSSGVARAEAISSLLTLTDRICLFVGVFLIAYAYGLDGTLRWSFESFATSSFEQHSTLATVSIIQSIIAAAAQPTAAKIADVFGRLELVITSVFFYVLGTVIQATSTSVEAFAAGAIFYQIGFTCVILLVEVIVADVTSMRSRVVFSYIPAIPFLINTWISGYITQGVLETTTWQWGIGMWGFLYPLAALPLIITLWVVSRRAKKAHALDEYKTPMQRFGAKNLAAQLFRILDVPGIILMIAIFALILTPLTIAGGSSQEWGTAQVIVPLIIGVLCVPAFVFWERRQPYPLVPFSLLKDRGVWGGFGIAIFLNCSWYLQGSFLFTVLIVAFDFSIGDATMISSLYSFCSVVMGILTSFVIFKVRRLKYFIVAGTGLFIIAFGLLIHFRGGADGSSKAGVIAAQVLLGIAGGLVPYPAMASVQAVTKHENMAVVTGLFLASYNIGSALGNCISGGIWTQTLYPQLEANLGNATLALEVYGAPFETVPLYPIGTPERTAIVESYQHVQRLLAITGLCLCIPMLVFALCLRNPILSSEQTQPEAQQADSSESKTAQAVV